MAHKHKHDKIFFTADLHFNHKNIIRYDRRPYNSVEHMNAALVSNWNKAVRPQDTVFVLGDFAFGKVEDVLYWAKKLNGDKILIKGNHDHKIHKLKGVFTEVHRGVVEYNLYGQKLLLSHYPYFIYGNGDDTQKFCQPINKGDWLLHGHNHLGWHVNGKQINVGVVKNGYTPVGISAINAIITAYKAVRMVNT